MENTPQIVPMREQMTILWMRLLRLKSSILESSLLMMINRCHLMMRILMSLHLTSLSRNNQFHSRSLFLRSPVQLKKRYSNLRRPRGQVHHLKSKLHLPKRRPLLKRKRSRKLTLLLKGSLQGTLQLQRRLLLHRLSRSQHLLLRKQLRRRLLQSLSRELQEEPE